MRQIKFRAWLESGNKMLDWEYIKDKSDLGSVITGGYAGYHPMQYTGLKDKNGKEIYEGDIVNTEADKNMVVAIGGYWETVGGHGNGVHITNSDETRVFGVSPFNQDNALEIIGNIYQSPELIKEE